MSYDIPDAPWIKYADTNGVPPSSYSEYKSRYRVKTVETDGSENRETFDDEAMALDFYQQCVKDKVLSVELWSIDGDGDHIDLIKFYEKEDE